MTIIRHADHSFTRGYYSMVLSRTLVSADSGAQSCVVWEQILPAGGYITPHFHDCEETLTFLSGRVHLTIGASVYTVEAETTVFIQPHFVHSVRNLDAEPARLIAWLGSNNPKVRYPHGPPEPVFWEAG